MRLYVNIDHVATVRQARGTDEPDPVRAAIAAELGGADGITVHLREDRRHIQDRDVRVLASVLRTGMNLELAAENEVLAIAEELRPMQATIVPERREEVTTEGGLDLSQMERARAIGKAADRLRAVGVRVSLFIDPDQEAIRASAAMGVEAVEFHTGEYALARGDDAKAEKLTGLRRSASLAREVGLAVHAGHGLTYENVIPVAAIPEIEELNIGHSIVSRSILVGMERAVQEMRRQLDRAPSRVPEPGVWLPPIGY